MATKTKKNKADNQTEDIADKIKSAYIEHLLLKGEKPASVFEFTRTIGIQEPEFYNLFGSFEVLEKEIWSGFIQTTLDTLTASAEYSTYPVREKLLSFYYTLIEVLKINRSFILMSQEKGVEMLRRQILSKTRDDFNAYAAELIAEGIESGEIVKRPYISDKYPEGLWLQMLFVLRFWINDESRGFEKTDAAIEKAVKLSFDLMSPGAVDSLVDMAKFLYQNK